MASETLVLQSFDKFRPKSVLYGPPSSHLNFRGGASVLVNGAVFKTVSEPARAGSGRFDSYTPPPKSFFKVQYTASFARVTAGPSHSVNKNANRSREDR